MRLKSHTQFKDCEEVPGHETATERGVQNRQYNERPEESVRRKRLAEMQRKLGIEARD